MRIAWGARIVGPAFFVTAVSLVVGLGLARLELSRTSIAVASSVAVGGLVLVASFALHRSFARRARDVARRLRASSTDAELEFPPNAVLGPVHAELLELSAEMRRQRRDIAQQEALLAAIVEMTPAAIFLVSSGGVVLATNGASRTLFFEGADVLGRPMIDLLAKAPVILRRALAATGDELFVIDDEDGTPHTHHLTKRYFELAGDDVVLVMLSDLSREISRQEVDVYKRVIRVLSHEINNSLAPISSLMHSARVLATNAPSAERLAKVFETVSERAEHLRRFLDGYAQLARLPLARKATVAWSQLFERLGELYPGIVFGDLPIEPGWFDRGQIEQVLVNLVGNAEEAGSARSDIRIDAEAGGEKGSRIVVLDRGSGMSPEVMKNALVPLFSTKERGSGLGLAICREIVEGHGGTLRLGARPGGGLEVVVRLPSSTRANIRSLSGPLHRSREDVAARGKRLG